MRDIASVAGTPPDSPSVGEAVPSRVEGTIGGRMRRPSPLPLRGTAPGLGGRRPAAKVSASTAATTAVRKQAKASERTRAAEAAAVGGGSSGEAEGGAPATEGPAFAAPLPPPRVRVVARGNVAAATSAEGSGGARRANGRHSVSAIRTMSAAAVDACTTSQHSGPNTRLQSTVGVDKPREALSRRDVVVAAAAGAAEQMTASRTGMGASSASTAQ
jgi:hypothetical protein